MKRQYWIFLFSIILAINIIGGLLKNQLVEYVPKPFIIISLAGYFLSQVHHITSGLKKWILLALFFSWMGDVLLIFQEKEKFFFLLGLSSFLLAHIFYIVFFHQVRMREKIRSNIWLLIPVAVYYVALISLLSPYLGDMKLPVRIYGIVISFMFMLALHMVYIKDKITGRWLMAGALLFIVSDSILATNKFYQPFEVAGALIMLTYGLAQFFIAEGASRYITSGYKE